jgi:hypothetical protein
VSVPDAPKPSKGGAAPSGAPTPTTEATTYLTSGESSVFGRVGVPGLLVVAVACALAGLLVRWYDPITRGVAAAGPTARRLARRRPGGRRKGDGA